MAKSNMDQDILKVLYSEEQLKTRVQEMGDELYERLKDKNPLFLGVLKGSFIFMADIVRACQLKSDIEFIAVSSYQNATTSSGVVQITRDLQQDITGRDIVVIEDILDSGNTLYFLKNYFMTKGASSVTVVTLLDKPAAAPSPSPPTSQASKCPTNSSSATASTTPRSTAICRTSACSSPRFILKIDLSGSSKSLAEFRAAHGTKSIQICFLPRHVRGRKHLARSVVSNCSLSADNRGTKRSESFSKKEALPLF